MYIVKDSKQCAICNFSKLVHASFNRIFNFKSKKAFQYFIYRKEAGKMSKLIVAMAPEIEDYVQSDREVVDVASVTDWTNVGAVVLTDDELEIADTVKKTTFGIPVFLATHDTNALDNNQHLNAVDHLIDLNNDFNKQIYSREVEHAASEYEENLMPPFFAELNKVVNRGSWQFECAGHQGGAFYLKSPVGRKFYDFYGERFFRADVSISEDGLGDVLTHDGAALKAEKHAAKVFNADKAYFVLNGSTTSNNIAITAAVTKGDLVLFDRNNHKSAYNNALVMNGGIPIYLETSHNSYGLIGGIKDSGYDEKTLRDEIRKVAPEKADQKRPFRLAIIEHDTYDGTMANAQQIVDKIGHLCDYILFDSAWAGYEQFIPMMKETSPLLVNLGPEDPGLLVVQSIHKQQAGISQASQILKKDSHIKGQRRYISHKQFNNSFMKYSSTSPFYGIFASIDVSARMQEGETGKKMWNDTMLTVVRARKRLLREATMIRPFVPPMVHGKPWEDADDQEIVNDKAYWAFDPDENWHGFDGYSKGQYFIDPNKLMLVTAGLDIPNDKYEDFGVPGSIVTHYLHEHGIINEKNDLNSVLFLITPAEDDAKMNNLVDQILKLEKYINEDAPLKEVLPHLYQQYEDRYKNYTIRQLCQEIHDFYKSHNAKKYQKDIFTKEHLPERAMTLEEADTEYRRNNVKLVKLDDILGKIAVEGIIPYPPGIFAIAPGERWTQTILNYFKVLEESTNKFPGFSTEVQGMYYKEENGQEVAYGYVYDPDASKD